MILYNGLKRWNASNLTTRVIVVDLVDTGHGTSLFLIRTISVDTISTLLTSVDTDNKSTGGSSEDLGNLTSFTASNTDSTIVRSRSIGTLVTISEDQVGLLVNTLEGTKRDSLLDGSIMVVDYFLHISSEVDDNSPEKKCMTRKRKVNDWLNEIRDTIQRNQQGNKGALGM